MAAGVQERLGMPHTVAILNSNEDVLEMLRFAFEDAGFNTVTAHVPDIKRGHTDFLAFLEKHDPDAIIYDIAPPYRDNWTFLQLVLSMDPVKRRKVVLTTSNRRLLQETAGEAVQAFEISEKPYDIQEIVSAAQRGISAA
jgi:CheY-like chemotaxis protein